MNFNDKGRYWQINQRQKNLFKVRIQPWAPLIEEKEIQYVKWFFVDVRIGYWKGREVGAACSHFVSWITVLSMCYRRYIRL